MPSPHRPVEVVLDMVVWFPPLGPAPIHSTAPFLHRRTGVAVSSRWVRASRLSVYPCPRFPCHVMGCAQPVHPGSAFFCSFRFKSRTLYGGEAHVYHLTSPLFPSPCPEFPQFPGDVCQRSLWMSFHLALSLVIPGQPSSLFVVQGCVVGVLGGIRFRP